MTSQAQYTTAAIATGFLGGAYLAYHYYQSLKNKLPNKWTQVGTLSDLYAYPIKSCGPVLAENLECTEMGLKDGWLRDRTLMVIDEKNNFVTARAYPELLLVQTSVRSSILTLTHRDMDTININLAEVVALQKPMTATVWSVQVPVFDCGKETAQWFSKLLNRTPSQFRLVYYASQECRPLRSKNTNSIFKFTKSDSGALPDEVAYNLINQASVDDLNTRMGACHVTHKCFRPNFVLKGVAPPYDEDDWKFVKIGEHIIFEIIKPCTRCVMTTIDPETGVHYPNAQPLDTLKSYRLAQNPKVRQAVGTSPMMGIQMALRSGQGEIVSLNDPIYVAKK